MTAKLTLRLDADLIHVAKEHSTRSGRSVSKLVADFFALIEAEQIPERAELTPRIRSLVGAFQASDVSEEDYRRHLEEKHA